MLAAIFSLSGLTLTQEEKSLFRESNPLGFILFGRNCQTPAQLRALTDSLRDCMGRDCPILIDQEGGRVQRLKPPHWTKYPPMRDFGKQAEDDLDKACAALRLTMQQLAEELVAAGITVNCAPVLDVLTPATHQAIGDRAFSASPHVAGALGHIVCEEMLAAGITPVIKHMPGHGRGTLDSHHDLPVVDAALEDLQESDFLPFAAIARSPLSPAIWGMSAHIMFPALDADHPASVSPVIMQEHIRKTIGFDGFLLTDDLDMKALDRYGSPAERACLAIQSGADAALYCAGDLKTMEKIAESVPKLSKPALNRLQKAAELSKLAI
jgi:beta-N-acetylhexosaminidase